MINNQEVIKMNRLIENHYITEIKYGTDFAYILKEDSSFLPTEYKMLQSQDHSIFLKCMKMYFNGKAQLFYLTRNYTSLITALPRLNPENFMLIVSNLFGSIIEVKNHGFLSCKHIDISLNHIFIDTSTYKVKLVYIPIANNQYDDNSIFEIEIRTNLVKIISEIPNISSTDTMGLLTELQNGSETLESIYLKLNGKTSRKSMNSLNDDLNSKEYLKLIAMDVQPKLEVVVNKSEFTIGRKQSSVDGVVSFNKAIGRIHCRILCNQGKYYIEDLNSANGTYVNNVRLQPNKPTSILQGDIVRLANSDFQVVLS